MVATRMVEGYSLTFEWRGGEYIDISFTNREDEAWGCINTDPPREFTWKNFEREISEWINDPEATHAHDLREYNYGYRR